MNKVKEDIVAARELIKSNVGPIGKFSKYGSVFLFGTENQKGVNGVIDYKDKDVITVASSGDQYVGAVYYGANKVDIYDINRLTYYLTCLKIASFITLSYEDFINFLVPVHSEGIKKTFWNLETLKRVIPNMPADVAYFWDNIMYDCKKYGFDGDFIVPEHMHSHKDNVVRGMPFYYNEKEYYKLQTILRKRDFPKFYEADILSLGQVICDDYDVIYLSNIIECLVYMEMSRYYPFSPGYGAENRAEEKYIFEIAKEVMPHLREDGTILFSYRPNTSKDYASDLLYQNDYFEVTEIESKYPPQDEYNKCFDTDLVLTYKPKKNGNILDLLK